jgi:hypothetical protein
MTPQEIFNKTARHCFNQGIRATDTTGYNCLYLDSVTQHTCAVGCHLSPATLDLVVDIVLDVGELIDVMDDKTDPSVTKDRLFLENHRSLLSQLQGVHDNEPNWQTSEKMRNAFNDVAFTNELEPLDETYRFADR